MTVEDMKFDRRIIELFIKNVKATQNSTVHIESVRLLERVIAAFNPYSFDHLYYREFVNPECVVLECDELYRLFDVICSPELYTGEETNEDHGVIVEFLSKVIVLVDEAIPNPAEIEILTNHHDITVKSGEFDKYVIEHILKESAEIADSVRRGHDIRPLVELIAILRYVPVKFMVKNLSRTLIEIYRLMTPRGHGELNIGNVSIEIAIEILYDIVGANLHDSEEIVEVLGEAEDAVNLVLSQSGITHRIDISSRSRSRRRRHERLDERDLRRGLTRHCRDIESNHALDNRKDEYKIARMLLDHVNETVSTTEITRGKTNIKDMDIRDVIAGSQHEEEFVEFTVRIKLK